MGKIGSEKLKAIALPAFFLALFFALWEFSVKFFGINRITLPAPSDILAAALADSNYLLSNLGITAFESVLGFMLGFAVAFFLAMLFVYSKNAKNTLYPFAIALKATPLVALAPLIVLWLGSSVLPMIVMAALVAFFPILVNSVEGLEIVEKEKLELFQTFGASKKDEFFKLRLPTSMPFIFSSLKIASTLAVVGAIIGEFTGSGAGLGFVIVNASYYLDIPLMFAAILAASVWGILFFALVSLVEKNAQFFQKLTAI
ncbi:MAG: ABC transporter permease [Candidatus Diapherotrites archaeon]